MGSYDMGLLESRIQAVSDTAFLMTHKIHGNPPGILDDLLDGIINTINSIRDSILNRVREWLGDIWNAITSIPNAIERMLNTLANMVNGVIASIINKLGDIYDRLTSAFTSAMNTLVAYLREQVSGFVNGVGQLVNTIKDKIGDIVDGVKTLASNLVNAITSKVGDIVNSIKEFASNIVEKVKTWGEQVAGAITSAYNAVTEKVRQWLQGLVERIKDALATVASKLVEVWAFTKEEVYPRISTAFEQTWKSVNRKITAASKAYIELENGNAEGVKTSIYELLRSEGPWDLTAIFMTVQTMQMFVPQAITALAKPTFDLIQQAAYQRNPVLPLDSSALIAAVFKGLIPQEAYYTELGRQGISKTWAQVALEAARPVPPPGDVQAAYLRGLIDESTHDTYLRAHGYSEKDIKLFKALYYAIPPLSDIIRMAVREAFSPDIAKKFGQYEDLPNEFVTWAAKQGLSKEWAERYWAAHWDLPSPQMGFEMLHRGIISTEELKLLLRALDVMPFWRDKLIQLSYAPYTRVDVRRMYTLGILDEQGVYKAYKELGYDDEKARNLTLFTVRYYAPEEETELDKYREAGKTVYIQAYKRGIIGADELREYLRQLKYADNDIDLMVALADAEMAVTDTREDVIPLRSRTTSIATDCYKRGLITSDELTEILRLLRYTDNEISYYVTLSDYEVTSKTALTYLEAVHDRYISRTIDKNEAIAQLGKLFVTGRALSSLFDVWDIEREARTRKPTEAQFRAMLKAGIISVDEYAEELRGLGYDEKYIKYLVQLTGVKYAE